MVVLVSVVTLFILALAGIIFYYKFTDQGKEEDLSGTLRSTKSQNKQVDVLLQQDALQKEINQKLSNLYK